jgi:hypothetical protein
MIDVVEQPGAGWAVLMVDVQGSGPAGRRLAGTLMHMTRECLAAGVAPDTTVCAVHQHLFAVRQGKVGASIHVCIVDAASNSAQVAGLGPLGVASHIKTEWNIEWFRAPTAGFEHRVDVQVVDFRLLPGYQLVLANDGITQPEDGLASLLMQTEPAGSHIESARVILNAAIARASGRPRADMAVALVSHNPDPTPVGRMLHAHVSFPVRRAGSSS